MINYKDIKQLGFKKHKVNDKVFKDKHGYNYFWMELVVKRYTLEWDSRDLAVVVYIETKDDAMSISVINDLDVLRNFIKFIK